MSSDSDAIPVEACAPPGTIRVTDRALKRARQFQDAVPFGWISTFLWCDGREKRASKDAPWEDQGPGLDLGAYRVEQIPKEAVCTAGSLKYAVCISKDIIDSHPERTIDLDKTGSLVLR